MLGAQYRDKMWLLKLRNGVSPRLKPPCFNCQIGVAFVNLSGKETLEAKTDPVCWQPEQNDQMIRR